MTASGSRNFPNATVFGSGQKLCQNWLRGSLLPTSCALSTVPAMDEKVSFFCREQWSSEVLTLKVAKASEAMSKVETSTYLKKS